MENDDTLKRVTILNSENYTKYEFWVVCRRLAAFSDLVLTSSSEFPKLEEWGNGVDSAAVMGMSLVFDTIPSRFPVRDILLWLRDYIDPSLPLSTVESGLIVFARNHV